MFGTDADWYLQNLSRISAFQKYIKLVETDVLPKQIANLVKEAAEQATSDFHDGSWNTSNSDSASGYEIYWFLDGSYDDQTEIGVFIDVWIPANVEWVSSGKSDPPFLRLCTNGGGGRKDKATAQKLGLVAGNALKSLPPKIRRIRDGHDYNYYYYTWRTLADVLNGEKLAGPENLKTDLAKIFKEFSAAMLPGLKAVEKYLHSRQ